MKYTAIIGSYILDFVIAVALIAGVFWMANEIQNLTNTVEYNKQERNRLIQEINEKDVRLIEGMQQHRQIRDKQIQDLTNRIEDLETEIKTLQRQNH